MGRLPQRRFCDSSRRSAVQESAASLVFWKSKPYLPNSGHPDDARRVLHRVRSALVARTVVAVEAVVRLGALGDVVAEIAHHHLAARGPAPHARLLGVMGDGQAADQAGGTAPRQAHRHRQECGGADRSVPSHRVTSDGGQSTMPSATPGPPAVLAPSSRVCELLAPERGRRYRPANDALLAPLLDADEEPGELLHGTQVSHRFDRPLEVEGDVLVEEDVAEPRKLREPVHQGGRSSARRPTR